MWCNISNNTDTFRKDPLGPAYIPLFVLGFVVNAAALRTFIAQRKAWTDTHIYMFNLVLADSALILFLPFRIYDSFICLHKTHFCTFLIYTHYINMYASILTTTTISVQRYLAVRFPLHFRAWRKKKQAAVVVCLVFWVFLVLICVIFREENYPENLWTCYERCKNKPLRLEFIIIVMVLGYLAPLLITVFCSSQIIHILLKVDNKSEQKKSTISIVTANMIVFIVCYTPIHIAFVVNYLSTPPENSTWGDMPVHMYLLASELIASTNCCLDSVSYYFLLVQYYSGRAQ